MKNPSIALFCLSVLWSALFITASGCRNQKEGTLPWALNQAGENRKELVKVLRHYSMDSSDSLKLQAARFLIAYMPGHFSLTDHRFQHVENQLHKSGAGYLSKLSAMVSLSNELQMVYGDQLTALPDIETVTAEFLIAHIDHVFGLRERLTWLPMVSQEDFFEYVLPYRILHEPLQHRWDSLTLLAGALEGWSKIPNLVLEYSDFDFLVPFEHINNFTTHTLLQQYYHPSLPADLPSLFAGGFGQKPSDGNSFRANPILLRKPKRCPHDCRQDRSLLVQ
ncbi:MAG: hypothetical protein LUD68_04430 [Rikenellaceae bacterium]|nr:hypothetical protein [Rikenellaceae bacterium]